MRSVKLASLGLALLLASGVASAALNLRIDTNPDPVRPGELMVAKVTLTNDGAQVNNLVLNVKVPAEVNAFAPALLFGGGTCGVGTGNCDPNEQIIFNLVSLAPGAGITVSVPMIVNPVTVAGTAITIAAQALISGVVNVTSSDLVAVSADNALTLAVDEDRDAVLPGETLTYDLTYGNRSGNSVTDTSLSFPIPAGTTLVSSTGGTPGAGVVTWSLGTLVAGQSGHQQVVVTAGVGLAAGSFVSVDAATLIGTGLVPESARGTARTRVATTAPLGLGVEINPDPVRPNEQLRSVITVTNRSGAALFNAVLRVRVPAQVDAFSPALVSGAPNCGLYFTGNCDANELVVWSLGNIAGGAGVSISMPAIVADAIVAGRLIGLEAIVTADGGLQSITSHTVAVDTSNALTLEVDDDKDAVVAGETLTYNLTYGNRSLSTVSGTQLSFPLPVGTTLVSSSGGTAVGGAVSWSLGNLLAGQAGRQQVVVTVNGGVAAGTLLTVNAATLAGTANLIQQLARGTSQTRVDNTASLGVGIEMNPDPARPGERLRSVITVTNPTGATLFNVVLRVRVPAEVDAIAPALLSGGPPNCGLYFTGNCDTNELVVWSLGNIAAGSGVALSMPSVVTAGIAAGRLINLEAIVVADGGIQAVTAHTVAVDSSNLLTLEIDDDKDAVLPGETLTYDLTYGNRGLTTVSAAQLSFPLPAGTTLVSAPGGTQAGNVVSWSLGNLLAGQAGRQQVIVTVNGGVAAGTLLRVNNATLSGANALSPQAARATSQTRVDALAALGIALEVNPDPVRSSERLRAVVTVTNRTGAALFNAVLRLRVPVEVNAFNPLLVSGAPNCGLYFTANCDVNELVVLNLGNLAAGAGDTLSIPMIVAASLSAGRLINIEAIVVADGGNQSVTEHTVAIDTSNALTVEVDDDRDAVLPGEVLTYSITYGNRSAGTVTGTQLTFPIPEGTTLASRTGGTLSGSTITWNLGALVAGSGGRRLVRVNVPLGSGSGVILPVNYANLTGNGATPQSARSVAASRTDALRGLSLTLGVPDPIQPLQTLQNTLKPSNETGGTLTSLVLRARVPFETNAFSPALAPGAACSSYFTGNCDNSELVTFSIASLAAGATTTLTMPPIVTAGIANGRLIQSETEVRDSSGTLVAHVERTTLVAPTVDADGDAIPDVFDNCLGLANPTQLDADGDGYGNACDADLNNSGVVTTADFGLLRSVLNQSAASSPLAAAADLNESGTVTTADFGLLRARLNTAPGPSSLAP